ncbi:MAG: N-6 DNA methylase [Acidimicrobiaceae bacterium]|nr:N-6 DNA methylase [Acidimicrobiaceae bacterium]
MRADFILENPPFNVKDWGGERLTDNKSWQFGVPPVHNANVMWVQHMVHHLSPVGIAGFVLANGSMSSRASDEGDIRSQQVEADLVDYMVALPDKLFDKMTRLTATRRKQQAEATRLDTQHRSQPRTTRLQKEQRPRNPTPTPPTVPGCPTTLNSNRL